MATTSSSLSTLRRLRTLVPHRDVSFDESLQVAERQATMLHEALAIADGGWEARLDDLPRVAVTFESISVSGMSHWNGAHWIITINSDDSLARQRFTMLHEFKHIIDHCHASQLYTGDAHRTPSEQAEAAADYFAGCALMPKRQLKSAWGNGIQRISLLADHFGASEAAVRVRLGQTGLDSTADRQPPARCARPISTRHNKPQRFRVSRPHYARRIYA